MLLSFCFLLGTCEIHLKKKKGHPQVLLGICTQAAPKSPWREPGHEGCCRVCLRAEKVVYFPGAEKYWQTFVTTLQGAKTPGLSSQLPRYRCFDPTRQLVGFQLISLIMSSMDPRLSAEHNLICRIYSELSSSHAKSKVHASYGCF